MRHVEVAHLFMQEALKSKLFKIGKIDGKLNPANALTKHLPPGEKAQVYPLLGLVDLSEPSLQKAVAEAAQLVVACISDKPSKPVQKMPWKPN